MKSIRYTFGLTFILLAMLALIAQPARAQSDGSLALVIDAKGPIMPPMLEYIKRGIATAERENAEVLIIQLNTPGGSIDAMLDIITEIRASTTPVVVYVAPRNAYAGSAGAPITFAAHASAMAPETFIGAATPIDESGTNLNSDAKAKASNSVKAAIRPYLEARGAEALELGEATIDEALAATANEALEVHLVDFVVDNVDDLLEALDGFTVQMDAGPRTLQTANAHAQPLDMSLIEQILLFLTDPNIVFSLFSIGAMALLFEITSPGGWVSGFIGVVCITLSIYGIGVLPINGFGIIFLVTAFVLFILDIKAPTHGALTAAGVVSFIIGALVLFNSPGVPHFQRVSVPLVFVFGIGIGLLFLGMLMFALRALNVPISMGAETYVGKAGTAKMWGEASGQVQLESELWSAEAIHDSEKIGKGDKVEVVEVKGLRLKVKKIK